ncbi:MAG: alpha amylase C-terminal domain-containing protein [Chromatiales bacterium]|nr:alpha amylase C-terminal domain-containing protein [Chromatiales bacterium]
MGNEIAQWHEWRPDRGLDWDLLEEPSHRGVQLLLRDLNRLYRTLPALHQQDFEGQGFSWIDCHDADQSVISFLRYGRDGSFVVVALNFTPVPRHGYRLGVPTPGLYAEVLNSDSAYYGGSNTGNGSGIAAVPQPWMGRPASIEITLPPLAGVILQLRWPGARARARRCRRGGRIDPRSVTGRAGEQLIDLAPRPGANPRVRSRR